MGEGDPVLPREDLPVQVEGQTHPVVDEVAGAVPLGLDRPTPDVHLLRVEAMGGDQKESGCQPLDACGPILGPNRLPNTASARIRRKGTSYPFPKIHSLLTSKKSE